MHWLCEIDHKRPFVWFRLAEERDLPVPGTSVCIPAKRKVSTAQWGARYGPSLGRSRLEREEDEDEESLGEDGEEEENEDDEEGTGTETEEEEEGEAAAGAENRRTGPIADDDVTGPLPRLVRNISTTAPLRHSFRRWGARRLLATRRALEERGGRQDEALADEHDDEVRKDEQKFPNHSRGFS